MLAEIIHPPWWMWANCVKVMHHEWLAVGEHCSWSFPALWAANGAEHISVGETNTMAPLWCQMCCQLYIVSSNKAHTPGSGARRAFKFGMRYSAVNVPAAHPCPPTVSTTKLFSHSRLSWLFFPLFLAKRQQHLSADDIIAPFSLIKFLSFWKFTTSEGSSLDRKWQICPSLLRKEDFEKSFNKQIDLCKKKKRVWTQFLKLFSQFMFRNFGWFQFSNQ